MQANSVTADLLEGEDGEVIMTAEAGGNALAQSVGGFNRYD